MCWQKITDFNKFYVLIEQIQERYNEQFLKVENYLSFDDQSQYYVEVDAIHNEFKKRLFTNIVDEDKKITYTEPFCTINVDEEIDKLQTNSKPIIENSECANIKVEEIQNDEICMENLVSKDYFSVETLSEVEDEDEDDKKDDDEDYENEENESSESSYEEFEEKLEKIANTKSKKKNYQSNKRSKNIRGKIMVNESMNILDEDNQRLLKYIQMKCAICSDERIFDSFSDVQVHFLDAHNQSGYIICCNRKFRRIGRVLQHCTWHDNPEAFKYVSNSILRFI